MPDIQTYSRLYPNILRSQIQWVVDNADSINFVLQQGDMTDHNIDKEWKEAAGALNMMDNKLPYAFVMGNHDLGKNSNKRDSELFNHYFPYDKYSKTKNFGGAFEEGKMDNVWYTFKAGGLKWLILCLEFGPRNSVLDWAGKVVQKHPDHKVIINTHAYMYSDDTRMGEGDRWLPQKYGLGKDTGVNAVNNGEQMWDKLVSKYPNILFVFSGHVLNSGIGTLVSTGEHGNKVYQMLANFQDGVKGSNKGQTGFLRIVNIDITKRCVSVETYSPYLKEYRTDKRNKFSFVDVDF
ncbi:metallophosphoesterase [Bacteroides difficilis]|uniref:metallophosphoesterase n=1 Tax=Bacteroides difficilis TaxID=2763021 RepID=UPI003AACF11C